MVSNNIHVPQLEYNPSKYKGDGLDHINISLSSKTKLGKAIRTSEVTGFKHKVFGAFNSIQCFWYYICSPSKDDRLRYMNSKTLLKHVKSMEYKQPDNFEALIIDAIYECIIQRPDIKEAVKKSTLPFDMYIEKVSKVDNVKRYIKMRTRHHEWLIWGYEEIRKAIQEGRKLNLDPIISNKDIPLYQSV